LSASPSRSRAVRANTASLALTSALALGACRNMGRGAPKDIGAAETSSASTAPPLVLPVPCIEFLGELQCWLRSSGNAPVDVEHAVGNARSSFQRQSKAAESCENALVRRAERFASAGCADSGDDLSVGRTHSARHPDT